MSDVDIPRIELALDDYFEENEPYQRRSEEELEETYPRLMFENYSERTLREVLGDECEENIVDTGGLLSDRI